MRLILACLFLAASPAFIAPDARAQCHVQPVATLPLLSSGRPVVEVSINDRPVAIMVDTGAEISSVTPEIASALGLRRDPTHRTMIQGVGGKEQRWNAIVRSIRIGSLAFSDLSLPVVSLGNVSDDPAGLLGMDLLARYDLELDFPDRRLTLYPSRACSPVEPPWPPGSYRSVETLHTARPQMIVPVDVNGLRFGALFDTGAGVGVLDRAAAEQMGFSTVQIDTASVRHGLGVNAQAYLAHPFRFETMTVGGEVLRDVGMGVGEFHLGIDMILGNDYMGTRRFYLSMASQRLFIQGASSAPDACRAPANLLSMLSRVPLVAVIRPRFEPPEKVRAARIEGCAGAVFRVGPDGTPRDIRILTEWPLGSGLADYVAKELSASKFQPPVDGTDSLHYEAHRLHPN